VRTVGVEAGPRRVVPDASVAVKWLVPEAGSAAALELLESAVSGAARLVVPDLWWAEVANTLWKKTRRAPPGRLTQERAARTLERFLTLPVATRMHTDLLPRAFVLAVRSGITVYDAMYVALAESEDAVLITADGGLARAVGDGAGVARLEVLAHA
jgi:predicted nucleic acid-binding protein